MQVTTDLAFNATVNATASVNGHWLPWNSSFGLYSTFTAVANSVAGAVKVDIFVHLYYKTSATAPASNITTAEYKVSTALVSDLATEVALQRYDPPEEMETAFTWMRVAVVGKSGNSADTSVQVWVTRLVP